ncbi:MAG TPA: helix-turn-helix domain-containing protein [Gemmatimonadales bacterium]|nr:helix-turn-helix domain-containing protein [Gemmatimonadales bacterium]
MNVKDQLLEAAAQVYAESGYHGATTRRIASAAGVNEITLFRHFGSKDVLLREAIARCHAEGDLVLPDVPQDPLQELTDWSRSHLEHLHQRATLIRTCLSDVAERPDLVMPEFSCPVRATAALAAYLTRLRERGLAPATFDVPSAAAMLLGALFADAIGRDIVPDLYATRAEEAAAQYVALFLRGIGVETSTLRSR